MRSFMFFKFSCLLISFVSLVWCTTTHLQSDYNYTKCLYFGRTCNKPHLIHVPPLESVARALTHQDLDIYLWSPELPYYCRELSNVEYCRYTYLFITKDVACKDHVELIVIHATQVCIYFFTPYSYIFSKFLYGSCGCYCSAMSNCPWSKSMLLP